jgi:hypothetical protein
LIFSMIMLIFLIHMSLMKSDAMATG